MNTCSTILYLAAHLCPNTKYVAPLLSPDDAPDETGRHATASRLTRERPNIRIVDQEYIDEQEQRRLHNRRERAQLALDAYQGHRTCSDALRLIAKYEAEFPGDELYGVDLFRASTRIDGAS